MNCAEPAKKASAEKAPGIIFRPGKDGVDPQGLRLFYIDFLCKGKIGEGPALAGPSFNALAEAARASCAAVLVVKIRGLVAVESGVAPAGALAALLVGPAPRKLRRTQKPRGKAKQLAQPHRAPTPDCVSPRWPSPSQWFPWPVHARRPLCLWHPARVPQRQVPRGQPFDPLSSFSPGTQWPIP